MSIQKLSNDDVITLVSNLTSTTHTLWVGNGIDIYLANAGGVHIPSWSKLIEEMEADEYLPKPPIDASFSERLEKISRKVGRLVFQQELRKRVVVPFAQSILNHSLNIDPNNLVPEAVRRVARLCRNANPIVNFNIESISSWIMGLSNGPCRISALKADMPHEGIQRSPAIESRNPGQFARKIFHPHGAIDLGGTTIMTKSDYLSQSGTLAFQLAIHQAFASDLVIIGMSLSDKYLREQIEQFRNQIQHIYYFTTEPLSPELSKWVWANEIVVYHFETWDLFWTEVIPVLPPADELDLHYAWLTAYRSAKVIINPFYIKAYKSLLTDLAEIGIPELYRLLLAGVDLDEEFEEEPSIDEYDMLLRDRITVLEHAKGNQTNTDK